MSSADVSTTGAPKGPWHRSLTVLLTVLVMADLVAALESIMIYSAFKAIIQQTGDPVGAGWLISAYFVVAGPAAVVGGRLGDMYGRKRVLIAVLIAVMCGSLVSWLSPNMLGMILGRGLQGVSGAIIPLCVAILRETAPEKRFSFGLGVILSAHALGTMLGLLAGGFIVDHLHWRMVFLAAAGAAAVGLTGVILFAPQSTGSRQKLDWLGLGIAPSVALLLFAISSINNPKISGLSVVLIVLVSLAMLAVWAWHELRQANPLVDLRALKNRNIAVANLTALIVSMGPSQISLYFSLLIQQPAWTGIGFGKSASASGAYKAPSTIISALLGPGAGYSAGRWGARTVLLYGAISQSIGWTVICLYHNNFWLFMGVLLLCSSGSMVTNVGITGIVTLSAKKSHSGEALGLLQVSKSIGNALGAQLVGLLLSLSLIKSASGKETFPDATAHTWTLVMISACSIAAVGLALACRRTAPSDGAVAAPVSH